MATLLQATPSLVATQTGKQQTGKAQPHFSRRFPESCSSRRAIQTQTGKTGGSPFSIFLLDHSRFLFDRLRLKRCALYPHYSNTPRRKCSAFLRRRSEMDLPRNDLPVDRDI